MRVTCRTLRATVLTAVVAAGLAVPTAAFAAPAPAPAPAVTAPASDGGASAEPTTPTDRTTPDGTDRGGQNPDDQTPDGQTPDGQDGQVPTPGGDEWQVLGPQQLDGGFVADVRVKASADSASATFTRDGAPVGSLDASGTPASTVIDGYTLTLAPTGEATATKNQDPVVGGWESKGTQDLGGGWTADIQVNVSARSAKADLSLNGSLQGSLNAAGDTATAKIGDSTFTLTIDGTATRKADPKPTPKPQPTRQHIRDVRLADGTSVAKVFRLADCHYQAEIWANGVQYDTLDADGHSVRGNLNGMTVTLQPDGRVTSSLDQGGKNPDHRTTPSGDNKVSHPATPKGGVEAGAQVSHGAEDTALLLGGGMAAAGLAGVGFTVIRRNRAKD
ncbi:hypothetical protein H9Y04_21235 [Streptomyces sp. TRM66268-LWL]|uniref:Gram-positive cocci surface proteins LPxTG domain-containing protein n=1 Tax=Streptomyces polyasparticus TaxID=2767826 RepID=A0ABR7SJD8_9ACTN|nr:hypothetical protein [Streptomyces polyasparticus]MBC9715079.1 hypothetical protein [Streptomyces polyasparticus]